MRQEILDHYLLYGMFTYPGLYEPYLVSLPDNVSEIGRLLRWSFIHRTSLDIGNTGTNSDLKFGDMNNVPWYRQAEDDNLVTTVAIIAELFRRDEKGLTHLRKVEDKVVLTCRYIALVMAAILKAKGIPSRVRSGFAGYWSWARKSSDHWITEYWHSKEKRWIAIDVDGSFHDVGFDLYDMPKGKFDYAADAWLDVREGRISANHFWNAADFTGLITIAWALFYDFHSLMNSEILYLHHPSFTMPGVFEKLSETKLKELDTFARLMQKPDENFAALVKMWNTNKEYRMLRGALL